MTRPDRRRLVADLRVRGASLRIIAAVVDAALSTVARDLSEYPADPAPEWVWGRDHKRYPATKRTA